MYIECTSILKIGFDAYISSYTCHTQMPQWSCSGWFKSSKLCLFLKVLDKWCNMSHELLSLFCRLLDVRHAQQSPTEIRLMLVFEYIDQDLSTYLQRCPSPGLGPERIRVGNTGQKGTPIENIYMVDPNFIHRKHSITELFFIELCRQIC